MKLVCLICIQTAEKIFQKLNIPTRTYFQITVFVFAAALLLMSCSNNTNALPVESSTEAPIAHILPIQDGPQPPTPPKKHKGVPALDDSSPAEIAVISIIALDGVETTLPPQDSSSSTTASSWTFLFLNDIIFEREAYQAMFLFFSILYACWNKIQCLKPKK